MFEEAISIEEFSDEIIGKDVDEIRSYLLVFLEPSNIKATAIDTVFMTGGTSMVFLLRRFMMELFGEHAVKSGDNFNSVANGLAYSHVFFKEERRSG